ncbi:MAG TPA: ABC transporter permease [Chitinophagaceae bacterium]|jgi:ABC-2 type transport system permease protein|nr:ABC transporter permease [Chitinophagaceae bacterium]
MSKISIIIKREYLSRVKRRSFIISTFLFPIFILLFIVGSVLIAVKSKEIIKIAVPNDSFLKASVKSDSSSVLFIFDPSVDQTNFDEKGYTAYLRPNRDSAASKNYTIISRKQIGLESMGDIRRQLNKAYEDKLLLQKNIDKLTLDSISAASDNAIKLGNITVDKGGKEKEANAGLAYGIGFGSGLLIYITMFIFGAMVMRGVMEEKMNRIAEVVVSSVKPFQLMMGKIVGIAAVGLTQFLMWIVLIIILSSALQLFIPAETLHHIQDVQQNPAVGQNAALATNLMNAKEKIVGGAQWGVLIPCFFFYFLGGYLFYAALFASVGSVVNEDPQEAQSLMLPITMPIIFSFLILSTSISHPNSPLAFWGSMIPFSSPIVMMGRLAYGVPESVAWWELFLSMALLIAGFIFTTWFAGKIYRTGILLYGKRVTWKEMIKWLRRSS